MYYVCMIYDSEQQDSMYAIVVMMYDFEDQFDDCLKKFEIACSP